MRESGFPRCARVSRRYNTGHVVRLTLSEERAEGRREEHPTSMKRLHAGEGGNLYYDHAR